MPPITGIQLVRMLARVDIVNSTTSGFTVEEVYLVNYRTGGYIPPAWDEATGLLAENPGPDPQIPAGAGKRTGIDDAIVYPVNGSALYQGEIYAYEAEAAQETWRDTESVRRDAVCLVIKGKGGDAGAVSSYYRVDFAQAGEDGKVEYMPLKRNYKYILNVQRVDGAGYASPQEALDAYTVPSNLKIRILSYNRAIIRDVVFNGQYMLGVEQTEYTLQKLSENRRVRLFTDYPGGWTARISADWLTFVGGSEDGKEASGGAGDDSSSLVFRVAHFEGAAATSSRNHFEKDRALSRRFQRIEINEPSEADSLEILRGIQPKYEMFHRVRYSRGAVQAAVELSSRYVRDRLLPDKAIDVMDEAGAAASLRPGFKPGTVVSVQDVERVVARMAGLPPRAVNRGEKERLRNLENDLKGRIFGQDEAVDGVTRAILRSRAGLGKAERPAAAFLFHGPTGVGKTELARSLADILDVAFLRFDMSEYMEKHAVARLIGSPPGYVGFEQGGLLTEAVRRAPRAVVLLDEIEKAHPDIYNILLQVMDYATLTDNSGRKADFRNVILIMTTNAGAREMDASPMGFPTGGAGGGKDDASRRGTKAVEREFSPEFRNRLDAMIAFHSLTPELMGRIVDKTVRELFAGLEAKRVRLILTDAARGWLAARGFDGKMGARPLQRLVRAELEDELAKRVLFGDLERGGEVSVDAPSPDAEHLSFSVTSRK